ncbi:MAG: glycosyltransferase, partial [Candidatus Altiarchaeales archaeon]|nr:glycosyltransferase [Candidatus Altiarchaeales archaeon]MBD3417314.1 glycosyltransferase [Candidatus Altiarchaeales archaeon]
MFSGWKAKTPHSMTTFLPILLKSSKLKLPSPCDLLSFRFTVSACSILSCLACLRISDYITPYSNNKLSNSEVSAIRVLEVTTSYPRFKGDWPGVFIFRLDRELVRRGNEVLVLAPGTMGSPEHEVLDGVEIRRFPYFFPKRLQQLAYGGGIPNNLGKKPWTFLQIPLLLMSFAFNMVRYGRKADIIHCHWIPLGFIGVVTRPLHGRHVVLTPWGSDYRDLPAFFCKFVLENSDMVISTATETEKYLGKLGFQDYETVRTPVDEDEFNPDVDSRGIAEEFGLGDEKVVVFVGRLNEFKDPMTFVEAAALVLGRRNDVRFIVVGDGEMKQDLLSYADGCGLGDGIIFT